MQYESHIAGLGFDFSVAPSGTYARLLTQGANGRESAFAWVVVNDTTVRFDIRRLAEGVPTDLLQGLEWWEAANGELRVRLSMPYYEVYWDRVRPLLEWVVSNPARARRRGVATVLGRRFGVELEFNGITAGQVYTALDAVGIDARPRRNRSGWLLKRDGSVRGRGTGGAYGFELVSPPLRGATGLEKIKTAAAALSDAGATVDVSCGLHVHFEMNDVRVDGIRRFAQSWFYNQQLLGWLVSRSRRNGANGYCHDLNTYIMDAIERASTAMDLAYAMPGRYFHVNVGAFVRHGTVEVRTHQGTLDPDKIEAWVRLGLQLIHAIKTKGQPVEAKTRLRELFEEIELDARTTSFLMTRARHFRAPAEVMQ